MAWYALMGGDPTNQNNYRLLPGYNEDNPPPCAAGCVICAVFVMGNAPMPNLTSILDRIANGLVTGTPQRPAGFPPKPYDVLLRC